VFARDDPDAAHGSGVWAVELRSGRETPVVPPVGSFIRSVQTSPAEDAVLFAQQEDDGAWRSYVAWGDGSHIRNAGRGTDVRDGRWSTSSSTYAYAEQTAQALELWIVPAGQPARRLASLPVGEPTRAQIAWSPNSKEIAVCLLPEGSLRVIDTTNGHIAELLPGSQRRLCEAQEATDRSPDRMAAYSQAWDASGDSLVFTAERNGNSDVYRWHRGDGRVDRLTSDASWEGNASWLRTASSLLQNVDLRIEQVVTCEWPTVTAYFSLIDASGAHAPGVPPGTCTVYEGVVEQRIVRPPDVKDQPGPMNIWVVIDRTGSMADVMDEVKRIAKGFCDIVRPQDRVQVATFGDRDVTPLTGLTSDLALVRTQIDGIEVGGDTNLFDAVGMTIEEAYNAVCGRKAIVLLTDGGENASRFWTNRQELMAAVEEAGTPIYAVGILGGDLDEEVMAEFAERSNGHYFPVGKDPEDMQTVFERIRTRIETQFHVIYEVKDPLLKNGGRTLMVRLRTPFGSLQDTCVYREPHARSAFDVRVRE
jgi:VWFA-related protein